MSSVDSSISVGRLDFNDGIWRGQFTLGSRCGMAGASMKVDLQELVRKVRVIGSPGVSFLFVNASPVLWVVACVANVLIIYPPFTGSVSSAADKCFGRYSIQ